jgi:glycosyltransferase involved in cell wall biosynthesis
MRFLLLTPDVFATDGGIARILRLYLKAVCEDTPPPGEVRLISLNDRLVDSGELRRYSNERLQEWQVCNFSKWKFIKATIRMGFSSDRIICGHVGQLPVAWFVSLIRPGVTYDLVAHGLEVWRNFSLLERLSLRRARRIHCVSDFTRQQLMSRCRLRADRVAVLYNALDPYLQPAEVKPAPAAPLILSISRLSAAEEYKGIDHLIMAMPAIMQVIPDAKLRIVGRGDGLPRLQALARKLGLENSVIFAGFRTDQELREEFDQCRVFALPSEKEGFGLVYLEALAHGRPCLAASAGGAPEIVSTSAGALVNYGDVPALSSALVKLLTQDWELAALLKRAREFSYENFKARLAQELV